MNDLAYELRKCLECSCSRCIYHGTRECYVEIAIKELNRYEQACYHDHNIYWDLAFKYDIENKLKMYMMLNPELEYVCIQGEGVGSVQGNPLKLNEDDLYVFNFIDSKRGRLPSTQGKWLAQDLGMKWVPILDTDYHMPDNMEDFKKYADGKSVVNPNVKREGVVIRNPKDDFSFKNVSREYLLKHNQ